MATMINRLAAYQLGMVRHCVKTAFIAGFLLIISRRGSVAPQADSSIRPRLYVCMCVCLLRNVSGAVSQKWLNVFLTHFAA